MSIGQKENLYPIANNWFYMMRLRKALRHRLQVLTRYRMGRHYVGLIAALIACLSRNPRKTNLLLIPATVSAVRGIRCCRDQFVVEIGIANPLRN